jgi:hypothetical protein
VDFRHPEIYDRFQAGGARITTVKAQSPRFGELFQRNCRISFEPVENSIAALADYIGPHKILGATDYPLQDGFFPGSL